MAIADGDIPYPIKMKIAAIASTFNACQYDAHDPNAAAIRQACINAGITPLASDDVQPRTIRGAHVDGGTPREQAALAAAIHHLACMRQPGAIAEQICAEDEQFAADLIAVCGARGWRLTIDRNPGAGALLR